MSPAVIGLDVGTSATKGIALDSDGTVLARAEVPYPLSTPRPGWSEQDPEDWWRASEAVLAQLRRETGEPAGIGLSGQMHGLVALDSADRVLRPAILWNDQRTAAECDRIEQTLGAERLIELTGNRALTGFTAPKLLWIRENEPQIHERIAHLLLPKDYVRLRRPGEPPTAPAAPPGPLGRYGAARRWSDEVLAGLAVDAAWLPRVLESPEPSGTTRTGAIPVAAGAGDQAAGALGVGVVRPGEALSVVLGTSGVVFAATDGFAPDPHGRVHAFAHAVPGAWHTMGVVLSAAGSLSWLRDAIAPDSGFADLVTAAESWPPGTENLRFLPYLAGERTPHADPDARGAFTGLSLRHDRGALVRAVLEGVAFALRDALDLVGADPGVVGRVSGGGARSELWLRILASVLEIELERPAADEGAAFGAALLGGVAAGVWADAREAVAATVRPAGARVEPVPAWVNPYREAHARYRGLYPALRDARPLSGDS
ncbi:MAG: Xylulose kinase [uncultured Solirubrobacteraceae bacterium]|uniref:Xylulose kinase n=1 Tax=uncultured Solirubrobacteraceae bacterium TaxID=1162706 RepID=A0A6J4SFV7_9ACTN|nr:MAG: Xylulose kinase [uncultured Solirubrobacteraceae bacterium]